MSEKLQLSPQYFVAEGADRRCFRHPDDESLCIKVLHPDTESGRLRREIGYYTRLQRRGVDFRHLTPYRGKVDTSLGKGAIFDLVVDDDGRISRSLYHYLSQNDRRFNTWIVDEIEHLKQNLYDQWIVFRDLNPTHILVRRMGYDEFRLVVIDGIGGHRYFSLANHSPTFARKKLVRLWNRRYRQWYSAFPAVTTGLMPYPAF